METRTRLGLLLTLAVTLGAAPATAQAPSAAEGEQLFHGKGNCYACHGQKATGGVGPNLTDSEWLHIKGTPEEIAGIITKGVSAQESKSKVPMPPKGGAQLSDQEVQAIAAYVASLSGEK